MVLSVVALTPFPEVPGADALGVPVSASGRGNVEPALFMAALNDLHRDAGQDARALEWTEVLKSDVQARFDLADAFAAKGLRRWTEDTSDGAVSRWEIDGKSATLAQVARRFWPEFRSAVLAELHASQEMPDAARDRIRNALQSRRDAEARKADAQALAYLKRFSWPVPVALQWIAEREITAALQSVSELRGDADWSLMSDLMALSHAHDLGVSTDLDESSPFEIFLRECAQRPGLLLGRAPDAPDFAAIDVRHLEAGALRFEGADYDSARSGNVVWTGVCVDRQKLWDAFPPPGVAIMESVKDMFACPALGALGLIKVTKPEFFAADYKLTAIERIKARGEDSTAVNVAAELMSLYHAAGGNSSAKLESWVRYARKAG